MARTRYLKPGFTEDTDLASVSISARYLYANLWCHMDRAGVCEADPKLIKKWVFPYDDDITQKKIGDLLAQLIAGQFLFEIAYENKNYLFCPTLKKHQWFHKEEKPVHPIPQSILKSAQCQHSARTEVVPNENATPNTVTATVTVTNNGNGNGKPRVPREDFDFDTPYKQYPRKLNKQTGLETLKREIKTREAYADFGRAVGNYAAYCEREKIEKKYRMHFSTFANGKWRNWVDPPEEDEVADKETRERDLAEECNESVAS